MILLLCDYDGTMPRAFVERVAIVTRQLKWRVEGICICKTRRGFHAVIKVRTRASLMSIVMAQALLGSDWRRETFNASRARRWRNIPTFWRVRANVLYTRHYRRLTP